MAVVTISTEDNEALARLWRFLGEEYPNTRPTVDIDADMGVVADFDLDYQEPAPSSDPVAEAVTNYLASDTSSSGGEEVENVEQTPPAADPTPTSPPARPEPVDHEDLGGRILAMLRAVAPSTTAELADRLDHDRGEVLDELRALNEAGRVEGAGRRGWKIRKRDIDYDAARARAAEAI